MARRRPAARNNDSDDSLDRVLAQARRVGRRPGGQRRNAQQPQREAREEQPRRERRRGEEPAQPAARHPRRGQHLSNDDPSDDDNAVRRTPPSSGEGDSARARRRGLRARPAARRPRRRARSADSFINDNPSNDDDTMPGIPPHLPSSSSSDGATATSAAGSDAAEEGGASLDDGDDDGDAAPRANNRLPHDVEHYQQAEWRTCKHCSALLLHTTGRRYARIDESRLPCCLRAQAILRPEDFPATPDEFQDAIDRGLGYGDYTSTSPNGAQPVHLYLRHQMAFINNACSLAHLGVQSNLLRPNDRRASWGWGGSTAHRTNLHLAGRTYVNWNPTHFFVTMLRAELDEGTHENPEFRERRREFVAQLRQMIADHNWLYRVLQVAQSDLEHEREPGLDAAVVLHPSETVPRTYEMCSISRCPGAGLMVPAVWHGISRVPREALARERVWGTRNDDGSLRAQFLAVDWPFDPAVMPLLFPEGTGGWCNFTDPETHTICVPTSTTGKQFKTIHAFIKAVIYQRGPWPSFSRCGNLKELLFLQSASRSTEIRLRQLFACEHIQRWYGHGDAAAAHRTNPHAPGTAPHWRNGVLGVLGELPSSVRGSPKFMRDLIANGMAVITQLGEPQYFITFTANLNWPEITAWLELLGMKDGNPQHHPDIVQRVFEVKLRQVLHDLRDGDIFPGRAVYLQYTVEWQKRGLPHAHILLKTDSEPIIEAAQADSVVSARIFDPEKCPNRLPANANCTCDAHHVHTLVRSLMQHQCAHRRFSCCKNGVRGQCRFGFPRETATCSEARQDGRWMLKREAADVNTVTYNATLLLRYRAHINVELCHGAACAYYIRKYMTKLPDCIRAAIVDLRKGATPLEDLKSAITSFQTMRYMGSGEAAAQCLGHRRQGCEPRCITLKVYLPGDGAVPIRAETTVEEADEALAVREDAVVRYMGRPEGPQFESLTFCEYFRQYNLATRKPKAAECWTDRCVVVVGGVERPLAVRYVTRRAVTAVVRYQTSICTGRAGVERYAFGLLLQHHPCRTPQELLLIDPDEGAACYASFVDAAVAQGFMAGERARAYAMMEVINPHANKAEWHDWLTAADTDRTVKAPTACHSFVAVSFFITLARCGADETEPTSTKQLFDWFWPYMAHPMPLTYNDEPARQGVLAALARKLQPVGWTLADIGLEGEEMSDAAIERLREMQRYDTDVLRAAAAVALSREQRHALRRVLDALQWRKQHADTQPNVEDEKNAPQRLFLFKGPAGSGKTHTINALLARARLDGFFAIATAFMAVAANKMAGGDTCHRTFGLKVTPGEEPAKTSTVTARSRRGARLIACDLIIIDEISMLHGNYLEAIDAGLRDLTCDARVFGGKVVLCVGDFKQLAPIVLGGGKGQTIAASPASRDIFVDITARRPIVLNRIFRQEDDAAFAAWCLLLGQGCTDASYCQWCWRTGGFIPPPDEDSCTCCGDAPYGMHRLHAHDGLFTTPLFDAIYRTTDVGAAHDHFFGGVGRPLLDAANVERLAQNHIIAFRNDVVEQHNQAISEQWISHNNPRQWTAYSTDKTDKSSTTEEVFVASTQVLNAQQPLDAPPHKLPLFAGAVLSLMRNLNPLEGLFNTATLIVLPQSTHTILWVKVLGREEPQPIPRLTFKCVGNGGTLRFTRRQFPVKFAYASTVNRVQGATLTGETVVDVRSPTFTHGQHYVALTRNSTPSAVCVLLPAATDAVAAPWGAPQDIDTIDSLVFAELLHLGMDSPQPEHVAVQHAMHQVERVDGGATAAHQGEHTAYQREHFT